MNDDLLVSWKDIAAHLKCSVRKAQRLERQQLPIKRVPGTKAVLSSKKEIDRWLERQTEHRASTRPEFQFPGQVVVLVLLIATTITAALSSAYGLTIVLFVLSALLAALTYPRLPDAPLTRALLGVFIIAGISYAAAASSLPREVSESVNMASLPPAFAYPFVTGLRFVPVPFFISVVVVVCSIPGLGGFYRRHRLGVAYLIVGGLLLAATTALGMYSLPNIWRAGLPIRWTLLAADGFILSVNLVLLRLGYIFFNSPAVGSYRRFFMHCGVGCLLIVLTAAITNRHWSEIRLSHLDAISPKTYIVRNPNATSDLRSWIQNHPRDVGQDLVALSEDPQFLDALKSGKFYKRDFDEAFQFSEGAVIYGFKEKANSRMTAPQFVLVRFPAELAAVLDFESGTQ